MAREALPADFFERLSEKQRVLLEILLEADGEYMRGVDIREEMRTGYDIEIGERGTAGVIGGFTRKYSRSFRDDLIDGAWVDEERQHAKHRLGEEYREEIRDRLGPIE